MVYNLKASLCVIRLQVVPRTEERLIMQQTRHKSVKTVRTYIRIRKGTLFRDNVAAPSNSEGDIVINSCTEAARELIGTLFDSRAEFALGQHE